MSDESKILSTEEIDALSKATQGKGHDLAQILAVSSHNIKRRAIDMKAFNNISELAWSECEKIFSSFLRKKINVKTNNSNLARLSDALGDGSQVRIFTVFKLLPGNFYAVVVTGLPLLNQVINFLFGGQSDDADTVVESVGKISKIVGEKICQIAMEAFTLACKEYGNVTFETIKTVTLPNLITKLSMEDEVYAIEQSVYFGDREVGFSILIAADFLYEFIPGSSEEVVSNDAASWRAAIQNQVVDSYVTVCASLPEIKIKASELVALKSGDLIPISDPTIVDISFNNTRLFTGSAGQENSNRVVKILSEI